MVLLICHFLFHLSTGTPVRYICSVHSLRMVRRAFWWRLFLVAAELPIKHGV